MYQLPVISVLLVSVLVGQVHPTPLKEQLNPSGLNSTSSKHGSDAPIKNSTEVIAPQAPQETHAEGSSSKANKTEVSLIPARLLSGNESTSDERKNSQETDHPCHYKKETDDMLKCYVMPHDSDEGEIADTSKGSNNTVPQKEETTKDEKPLADQQGLNTMIYHTASPGVDKNAKTNLTDSSMGNAERNDNRTDLTVSSVAPLLTDNTHNEENSENSVKVAKTGGEERKNMPSGVIALVTAITFILAVVFTYIIVIAWRRYVEYKYGHRELLVNDLEFDSNDLRHFEL